LGRRHVPVRLSGRVTATPAVGVVPGALLLAAFADALLVVVAAVFGAPAPAVAVAALAGGVVGSAARLAGR
jgi:hypothetical protein